MKRLFFISLSFLFGVSKVFATSHNGSPVNNGSPINNGAPVNNGGPRSFQFNNPLNAQSFTQLADNIVNFLLTIAVPIIIIMVIWAGLLFMTAGGNTDRLQQGKDTLLWTAIGIGVLMISKSVTYLLISILGG